MNNAIEIAAIVGLVASVLAFGIGVYKDAKKSLTKMETRREHSSSNQKRVLH